MVLKLDKVNKRILYELDKNARIPDIKLAKIVKKSKESVRYRIKKLQDEGIIKGFSIWIDPTKLGFRSGKIYLNLANIPERLDKFKEIVKNDKRLMWFSVAEGSWNIGLTYFVKSNKEFFDLKNQLFSRFKDLILESHTASLVEVNYCDATFLYETQTNWKPSFDNEINNNLDPLEKEILKILFKNSRANVVDIAYAAKTSVDKIRTRVRNLENKKIIIKYLVNIDYNKLNKEFFKTFLYFKNISEEDEQKLMNYAQNVPEIIRFIKQISPWDVELEVMCDNYLQYNEIVSDLTKEFSNIIQKTETAIIGEDYVFPAKKMIFE